MNYHAHVYWNNDQEKALAVSLRNHLKSLGCPLGRVIDVAIGPHPLPMFQVMYDSHNQKVVEDYLKKNQSIYFVTRRYWRRSRKRPYERRKMDRKTP